MVYVEGFVYICASGLFVFSFNNIVSIVKGLVVIRRQVLGPQEADYGCKWD